MALVVQHFGFGSFAAFAFLAAEFFYALLFTALGAELYGLYFVREQSTGQVAVDGLLSLALAFYLYAGREVFQVDAGRGFVDVLSAFTAGAYELFFNVGLADAEFEHALFKFFLLGWIDTKKIHLVTLTPGADHAVFSRKNRNSVLLRAERFSLFPASSGFRF